MRWAIASLGDVAEDVRSGFASGGDDPDGVVQFRMNNVDRSGAVNWEKVRRVPKSKVRDDLLVRTGDILFNATNSPELVGKSALFEGHHEPVTFSNHFIRLRTKATTAHASYIARWIQLQFEHGRFEGMCRSWVNQASITKDQLTTLEIPLPPLPEQRRIAAILDKADALRRKRQRAVDLLDSLTQSIFLEMFGDPVTNPRDWPQQNVRDVCRVVTGNTPSRQVADYFGKAIEWIKSDNIDTSRTYVTTATEYLSESGKRVGRVVPAGCTLITCIAGSPSAIGNSCMTDREVAFNQQINALVPETVEPFFLLALMRAGKQLIQEQSSGGMTGLVNKSKLESIRLIAPDRKLQNEFSSKAKRLEAIKSKAIDALASASDLFASLQSRAFAGEF